MNGLPDSVTHPWSTPLLRLDAEVDRLGADALLTGAVDARDDVRVFATKRAITAYRVS